MAEFEKMDLASADLVAERIEQLKQLLPEVATEGGIDFDKLRLVLGDEVDEGTERYAFTWPGKTDAIRQSQTPSTATLRPCPEESVNWDETENLYIEGDNLEVLKLLQRGYHGRVKLIYIDPPYNTGHDFVYKDSFGDTVINYREQAGLTGQSNADTSGRFHSDWCSMMYPRLKLARELLTDDGAIFISIDDNEETNLRNICDEIFGHNNFVAKLSVQVNPRGRNLDRYIAKTIEPVLVYVKDYEVTTCINGIAKDERMLSEYNREDERGRYRPIGLRNRNQRFNPQTRPNLYFPLWIRPTDGHVSTTQDEEHCIQRLPLAGDDTPTCWTWSSAKIEAENEYIYAEQSSEGWRVYRKDYLDEGGSSFTLAKSLQADPEFNNDYGKKRIKELFGSNVMSFPKSTELMRRIAEMGSASDSIVLDFFSGSATMADAVMQLNAADNGTRQFIMVQLPETCDSTSDAAKAGFSTICELGKERIRRAGAKIATEVEESNKQLRLGEEPKPVPDIGFRVLKLDESGIERPKPGELLLDVVKPDRSDEDIIFEMMLKWGLELTLPIEKVNAAGYPCYSVAYGELVCCLADGLNMQALDAIADMEPRRVLMLDRILDDTTKLNAVQAFKRVEEKTGREVELRTV